MIFYRIEENGKQRFIDITENRVDDALLCNLREGNVGKIQLYSVALFCIDEPIGYYDSLITIIETEVASYESEAYYVDKEAGWVDVDYYKYFALAKQLNKESDFWNEQLYYPNS